MLSTPGGTPASSASLHERERRQRRVLGRLADDGAAGGERRRDLARDHRGREVPRRDRRHHADRLLQREHAPAAHRARESRRRWRASPPRRTTRRSSRHRPPRRAPSASGLPCSREIKRPRSSWCARMRSFQRLRICARCLAGTARHAGESAACAASTAARASAAPLSGTLAKHRVGGRIGHVEAASILRLAPAADQVARPAAGPRVRMVKRHLKRAPARGRRSPRADVLGVGRGRPGPACEAHARSRPRSPSTIASCAARPAPCPCVRKSSISAPDQIIAIGLAMLLP